jgi:hypothetical protein
MTAMLRQVTATAARAALAVTFGALIGLLAYMVVHAHDQTPTARLAYTLDRPAAAVVGSPISVRPFAIAAPSPLDGVQGKGSWLMIFDGDWSNPDHARAAAIVDATVQADLSHLYVRVADSRRHFYAATALQDLLPVAHAHHLSVIGWIEPLLDDPTSDAADAIAAADFEEQGQRLDGLGLTIEGDRRSDPWVGTYLSGIRSGVGGLNGLGDRFLLIASTLPIPKDHPTYAYATLSRYCQVFAPMVYWRATGLPQYSGDKGALAYLDKVFAQFRDPSINPYHRPLSITAQAYDAAPEYGTPGAPPGSEMLITMNETHAQGGMSWSYYRLADANNGVTADEQAAITAYPFWHRSDGAVATKALVALPDQPVAY